MKNKKATKIKKPKKIKISKKKPLKVKFKRNSSFPDNQFEGMKKWLAYYEEHKKLPHNRIICSNCKMDFISLKGVGMFHAMKNFNKDMNRVLNESICKSCKDILTPKELKEPKEKVIQVLTREEMQARRDAISETLPKIDFYKTRVIIDITKDKDVCRAYTSFSCHRPDIYLDYGCAECALQKNCACAIKDVNRKPDDRRPKFKRAVIKPKS
jgi:hypothetical protein